MHHTTTVAEIPEENKSNDNELMILIISGIVIVSVIFIVIVVIKNRRKNDTDKQSTGPCILPYCQNINNTYIHADNLIWGDHNTMVIRAPSDRRDDDDYEGEPFIQKNQEEV